MSPALLDIYAKNWDKEGDSCLGMQCLEKLRNLESVFKGLLSFLA